MNNSSHVLIVGAGAAGLAAGRRLVEAGVPFTVLEARDCVGGRIRTLRSDGEPPIEAGPEFIHGDVRELEQLLEESQTATQNLADRHWRRQDGEIRPLDFDRIWDVVFERLRSDHGLDRSFAEFVDASCKRLTKDDRRAVIDYVEGFNAADAREVGIRWLRQSELEVGAGDEGPIRIVTSGFDRVVEALAAGIPDEAFRFETRVTTVRWRRGGVEIETTCGGGRTQTFAGQAAIVTLPVSILKGGEEGSDGGADQCGVRFEPEPAETMAALGGLRMGSVVKVKLRFDGPFWREYGATESGFLHAPGATFMTWWPLGDRPTLTGWSGGPRTEALAGMDEQAIVERAVGELAVALGAPREAVFRRLESGRAFDWGRDPWAQGAYSYAAVGGADAARRLAKPVEGTLFFAGEATDPEFSATIGGAIRSGRRAAEEALASLVARAADVK